MLLVSCLVLLTVRAAQGAASEVCRGSEPCSQWRVLMPQLRLTAFRLTGFIRWSCSCEAKAPARAPGGAGFKGQRPLRTVSPPFNLCLALIGLASIRSLLPRFGCTFVLAMISSVLSDFSVFFFTAAAVVGMAAPALLVFTMRAAQGAASEVR